MVDGVRPRDLRQALRVLEYRRVHVCQHRWLRRERGLSCPANGVRIERDERLDCPVRQGRGARPAAELLVPRCSGGLRHTRILGICWIFDPVWADFYFQWTSMPPVPVGDQIQILVRIEEVPEVGDQCVVPDETMILNPVNWPAGDRPVPDLRVIIYLPRSFGQGLGDLINDDCRMKVGIRRTSVNGEQTEAWERGLGAHPPGALMERETTWRQKDSIR